MRCRSNESANKDRKERRRGENSGLTSKTGVCAQVRACVRFSETHEKTECVLCVCNCVFYVYKSI